jgi:hypothetical protein
MVEDIRENVSQRITRASELPLWRYTARQIEQLRSEAHLLLAQLETAEQEAARGKQLIVQLADVSGSRSAPKHSDIQPQDWGQAMPSWALWTLLNVGSDHALP